jgi:hypothetical protein
MAKKEELKDELKEETGGEVTAAAAKEPEKTEEAQKPTEDSVPKQKKRKFVAVQDFKDLQDSGKVYHKGDSFPKPANKNVSEERLQELLTASNNQKRSVIKEVE